MPAIDISAGAGGDIPGVHIKGKHLGKKMQKAQPLIQQQNQAALEALRIKNARPEQAAPQSPPAPNNFVNNFFFGGPPGAGGGAYPLASPGFGELRLEAGMNLGPCGGGGRERSGGPQPNGLFFLEQLMRSVLG